MSNITITDLRPHVDYLKILVSLSELKCIRFTHNNFYHKEYIFSVLSEDINETLYFYVKDYNEVSIIEEFQLKEIVDHKYAYHVVDGFNIVSSEDFVDLILKLIFLSPSFNSLVCEYNDLRFMDISKKYHRSELLEDDKFYKDEYGNLLTMKDYVKSILSDVILKK